VEDAKNKSQKICFVISSLRRGGAELSLINLASCLAQENWKVTILTFLDETPQLDTPEGVNLICLNVDPRRRTVFIKALFSIKLLFKIRRQIQKIRPDVLVSFMTQTSLLVLLSSFGIKTKKIAAERLHPNYSLTFGGAILRPFIRLFRNLVYILSDIIVIQSPIMISSFPYYLKCKVVSIPNSLRFNDMINDEDRDLVILSVGRLVEQKNHIALIRAFACLAEKYPQWKLKIIGDGPLKDELLKKIYEYKLDARVLIEPNREDMRSLYLQSSIFCLPSIYEGFPNVLLEAMYFKLAVIATNAPGAMSDLIVSNQNGIIVTDNSEQALTRTLEQLISNLPLRRKLGDSAHQTALLYSPEKMLSKWLDIIKF
jgi:GalNAc-alpha-(1->4)-GalNAc-alpha-(1->3)-diNAcBac-PP-undecaprenol alpha-1,4-N-acetyl-D-galactosaminyltransferase